jgi:hypothetical protein
MPDIGRAGIDRHAVVSRHDVVLRAPDETSPLQVGNGDFAFGADVTGLQTFYGNTLSSWAWHADPLPAGLDPADRVRTPIVTHGRTRYYLAPHDQDDLAGWLYDNPHRLNLGRLFFAQGSGAPLDQESVTGITQRLRLWEGIIDASFWTAGFPVQTAVVCHPQLSLVAARVRSPLLRSGGLTVNVGFGYPVANGAGAERHQQARRSCHRGAGRVCPAGYRRHELLLRDPGQRRDRAVHRAAHGDGDG